MTYIPLTYYTLRCDGKQCTNELEIYFTVKEQLDAQARSAGWLPSGNGKHTCPSCIAQAVKKLQARLVAL